MGKLSVLLVCPMTKDHEVKACCKVYPKAYSWFLKDIKKVKKHFPVKGKLNIYDLEVDEGCL